MEIRRSYDRLISTMGFPIQVRWHLYIESGQRSSGGFNNVQNTANHGHIYPIICQIMRILINLIRHMHCMETNHGPLHLCFFIKNQWQNIFCFNQNFNIKVSSKLCPCLSSRAVVTYAKILGKIMICKWITAMKLFNLIWILSGKALVGLFPVSPQCIHTPQQINE